jgi:glycogen debranching enzyme
MKALSTNCLYYSAYLLASEMGDRIGRPERSSEWRQKAEALRDAINRGLWMENEGRYGYFLGNQNELITYMEGLGHSLAILLGVADEEQARHVLKAQHITPYGIPCVWPVFPRFSSGDGMAFGRHNGTVWPFIQGYWAQAAALHGRIDLFDRELDALTRAVDRIRNFMEIFHPVTGEPYGGLQIDKGTMRVWGSCPKQTWSSTAYLRMLYAVLIGMEFSPNGLRFAPRVPSRFSEIALEGLPYRSATLSVQVTGSGTCLETANLDGKALPEALLPPEIEGEHRVELKMKV